MINDGSAPGGSRGSSARFLVVAVAASLVLATTGPRASAEGERFRSLWGADVVVLHRAGETGVSAIAISEVHLGADGYQGPGAVHVRSLADGETIKTVKGTEREAMFGWALDAGPWTGREGEPAEVIVVAAPGTQYGRGSVRLFSSADGREVLSRPAPKEARLFGRYARLVPDVDGDGKRDLAVGGAGIPADEGEERGAVSLFSTATGKELWRTIGREDREFFGGGIQTLGDVDRDGLDDLLVEMDLLSTVAGRLEKPRETGEVLVRALSSRSGKVLWEYRVPASEASTGASIRPCRDLDGDGVRDGLAVHGPGILAKKRKTPMVRAVSGATGARLWEFDRGPPEGPWTDGATEIGDVNADGVPDIALSVSWPQPDPAPSIKSVRVVCGKTRTRLFDVGGEKPRQGLHGEIACPDADGDGIEDFLVKEVSEPREIRILLVSGKSGNVVRTFER